MSRLFNAVRRRAVPGVALGCVLMVALVLVPAVAAGQESGAPAAGGAEAPAPLRFFALGDLPYGPSEVAPMERLLAAAVAQGAPFIVHVGDLKSGSSPCTDEQLQAVAGVFRAVPVPLVYTPGDNEWTDCHRWSAGGLDPRARLARVREVFYADPGVLRLADLGVTSAAPRFPEVYGFVLREVLFVALHVVGSDNGYDADDPAAKAEFRAREAANRAFLTRLLASPQGRAARALVIMIQADPLFESTPGPHGFRAFKAQLVALMGQFPGPVLLIHGDTHHYRHDHPLFDPVRGIPFERLTRVEVPGSPLLGGVWVTVDPGAAEPFASTPVYAVPPDSVGSQ